MFRPRNPNVQGPAGPRGHRAYVVGDVHGMDDLLADLLGRIERDLKDRPAGKAAVVFVGDLIDRGPASAQVIERLRTYEHPLLRPVFLLGNHEEVLLRIVNGEADIIRDWLKFGGRECLASYGFDVAGLAQASTLAQRDLIRAAVPEEHIAFPSSFADTCRFGDYLIVHAGIRPGVELDLQRQSDLRWLREAFLDDDTDHGFVVVHGHTIVPRVEERPNRIAIDTGAYRTGILTALVLEGRERRLIATETSRQPAAADA